MSRALILSNGQLLVGIDAKGHVQDLFFPHISQENHIGRGLEHRIGIFVDGVHSWLSDDDWERDISMPHNSLSGYSTFTNARLHLSLAIEDTVYNERNIFLRGVSVTNHSTEEREVRVFFAHEFSIDSKTRAGTAFYHPLHNVIFHYKGRRVFLCNAWAHGKKFDHFTTGVVGIEGKRGSYVDAEDGELSQNPIEHGPADSVIGSTLSLHPGDTQSVDYWICVGETMTEVLDLNSYVLERSPRHLHESTEHYWNAWVSKGSYDFSDIPRHLADFFGKSLLVMQSQTNHNGAIIASCDTETLNYGKDTYNYMWPRDGAYGALAFMSAGDHSTARRFFQFCHDVMVRDGYLMHKYDADKSLGSSWHPWVHNKTFQLPIQEDETASVLFALWNYYEHTHDLEFIEEMYNEFIRPSAEFLVAYRDTRTGLPAPSYDLWEEVFGIHTYTAASVFGGLMAAHNFAHLLSKEDEADRYLASAEHTQDLILRLLWDEEKGYFYKSYAKDNTLHRNPHIVDASAIHGILTFGVLPPSDNRVQRARDYTNTHLRIQGNAGGVARYQQDGYYQSNDTFTGNPWIITTLWDAQHQCMSATTVEQLTPVMQTLEWTYGHRSPSGMLPEQVDPVTSEHLSACPLTWSHSEYVRTVTMYVEAMHRITKK